MPQFKVLRDFKYGGKEYKAGSTISMDSGMPRIDGLIHSRRIAPDSSVVSAKEVQKPVVPASFKESSKE
jgi:hypothetical protein